MIHTGLDGTILIAFRSFFVKASYASLRSSTAMNHIRFLCLLFSTSSSTAIVATSAYNLNNPTMKAWTCHGRTQKELVQQLKSAGIIFSPQVENVMTRVDRSYFTSTSPYQDAPQPIGQGQTISAPHMHAHVLELLVPRLVTAKPPLAVLDVGCGSGYLTACLAELVHDKGKDTGSQVYGIDVWPNLIQMSTHNINKYNPELLKSGAITLSVGDGWKGFPEKRFDAIHVGAAASEIPQALLMQLKLDGILIVPVGPSGGVQVLYQVERVLESSVFQNKDFLIKELLGVRYVPLIHPDD